MIRKFYEAEEGGGSFSISEVWNLVLAAEKRNKELSDSLKEVKSLLRICNDIIKSELDSPTLRGRIDNFLNKP